MGRASWLAWIGGALALGLTAFLLGLSGLFGAPPAPPAVVNLVGAIPVAAEGLDCPAGEAVTELLPGDRVFVTARSEDSEWLAVRSAAGAYATVWVAASALRLDDPAALETLQIDGCLTPTISGAQS